MTRRILRVRAHLDVTVRVPTDFEIDEREYVDWCESQPEPATYDPEQIQRFIEADDTDDWVRQFPNVDPERHDVEHYELAEVELLAALNDGSKP